MKNPFIPYRLHDLLILLKRNNMLKEVKYSMNHDVVKAIVIDKFNNKYCYINGFVMGYRLKKPSSIMIEVER